MTFRFEKLTTRAQDVVRCALERAQADGHPEVDSLHVLDRLTAETDGIVGALLTKLVPDRSQLRSMVESELSRLPHVSGGAEPNVSRQLNDVLTAAASIADGMKDEFVSTEHLLLGICRTDGKAKNVLELNGIQENDVLTVLSELRGSQRVTDPDPENKFQALVQYGVDLVEAAEQGKLDPVIGRDQEIRRVVQVLSRRTKNNPVLIGEPGVGKTAIAEGLALRIVQADVPEVLKNKRVVTLDMGALIAGAKVSRRI